MGGDCVSTRSLRGILWRLTSVIRAVFRASSEQTFYKFNHGQRKGSVSTPLGFSPKELAVSTVSLGPNLADMSSVPLRNPSALMGVSEKNNRLDCVKFDGSDFRGWWTKLEQYFEAEGISEASKVRTVMLNLEGRALEWHHYYSQRNGGLQMLSWPAYLKSLQDRFGFGQFGNPMKELVLLFGSTKKASTPSTNSPRSLLSPSVISGYSSSPSRTAVASQSASNVSVSKSGTRFIPLAVMAERKQKGLCFWCGAKYYVGHKCVKSQLYQFLWEPHSDGEVEEFQECSDKLEESSPEEESSKSLVISLHALIGLQGYRCQWCPKRN
ncbi:hypothetical protein PVK06_033922 [Gossypium arboreum]|uniref:Retrotransposon gag domain-containing protein n=1 Tax=Gossypium arboreum TaxID=29729 RepID=A0ABR0NCR8_GOSAR|nr:hypothetical protein PVK06_033922 [Gossypium arboreum]